MIERKRKKPKRSSRRKGIFNKTDQSCGNAAAVQRTKNGSQSFSPRVPTGFPADLLLSLRALEERMPSLRASWSARGPGLDCTLDQKTLVSTTPPTRLTGQRFSRANSWMPSHLVITARRPGENTCERLQSNSSVIWFWRVRQEQSECCLCSGYPSLPTSTSHSLWRSNCTAACSATRCKVWYKVKTRLASSQWTRAWRHAFPFLFTTRCPIRQKVPWENQGKLLRVVGFRNNRVEDK